MARLTLLVTLLALAAWACNGTSARPPESKPKPPPLPAYTPAEGLPGDVQVVFRLEPPAKGEESPVDRFFATPWPSELRRTADGKLDLQSFPGRGSLILGSTIAETDYLTGFSIAPGIYFRFTGPIDTARLPKPHTLAEDSSVVLVDVDPQSPERGRRFPLEHRYHPEPQTYIPQLTLALKLTPGFVLRPGTLYAAVIRRQLGDAGGKPLGTSRDLELIKWTEPRPDPGQERARALHAGAFDELHRQGLPRGDIAAVALFRTQAVHEVFTAMVEVATSLPPEQAPKLVRADWLPERDGGGYRVIRGYYCTPSFQTDMDHVPFLKLGGTVKLDGKGRPQVVPLDPQSEFRTADCGGLLRARFVLTVPAERPMPAAGWPLLIYAHGTTGDAFSFLGQVARWAAAEGVAVASTDQPLHGGDDPAGARPGSRRPFVFRLGLIPIPLPFKGKGSELAFYNVLRPPVLRDNLRQAAIDVVLLSRLLLGTDFAAAQGAGGALLPAAAPAATAEPAVAPPRFDRSKLMLMGHSQGSQSIAVAGAVDPLVRGVVLSACGGDVRAGFAQRNDVPVRPILSMLLGLEPDELDKFHPLLALAQTALDPIDPQSWAPLYHELLPGREPRSVLHFQGLEDTMTVHESAAALAVALKAQPVAPLPRPLAGLPLLGIAPAAVVKGNAVGGQATIALAQFAAQSGQDGHFVLFRRPRAGRLCQQFLGDLAAGRRPPAVGPRAGAAGSTK